MDPATSLYRPNLRRGELPELVVVVDGSPVPQPRARVVRGARGGVGRYVTPRANGWKESIAIATKLALIRWRREAETLWPLGTEYAVDIEVRRARAIGDLDNFAKAALDAMNGIAWEDDREIRELRVVRRDRDELRAGERPGLTITVRPGRVCTEELEELRERISRAQAFIEEDERER
jgi:Holliday junction resolvase RusA-like endonuclease